MFQAGSSTISSRPSACPCATAHCQRHALRSQSPSLAELTREGPNGFTSNAQTRCGDTVNISVSTPGWQDGRCTYQPCDPSDRLFGVGKNNDALPARLEDLFSFGSAGCQGTSLLLNERPQRPTISSHSSLTPIFTSPSTQNETLTSSSRRDHHLASPNRSPELHFVDMADKAACTRARNTVNSRKHRQNKVNRIRELESQLRLSETTSLEWERRARIMGWTE